MTFYLPLGGKTAASHLVEKQWRFQNEKCVGGHCGAKKQTRGGNINVSPAW